jgi:aspartate/methionine/tyrosine aminotransferase
MLTIDKFAALATDNAPGQEVRQATGNIGNLVRGESIEGRLVDFSHGDVDAFLPTPGALEEFSEAVAAGGRQAYTEYRGSADIRVELAEKLAAFTGAPISAEHGTIVTPGTQGALFLAVASLVSQGDKVAIVQPDYFANRKIVQFFGGIRDDLLGIFRNGGLATRAPQAGSYLFPTLPPLAVSQHDFVRLLRHQASVIVTAGTEFGPHHGSIRLNFSQDHAAAVAAGERIVAMANRYRRPALA